MTRRTRGTQKKGGRSATWPERDGGAAARAERSRKPDVPFDEGRRRKFLAALRLGFSVAHAAAIAGSTRSTAYRHREEDPNFAEAWDMAVDEGTDRLEDAARQRALGAKEPVFYQGKIVGAKLVYSDVLLLALLNARRPEKFKYRAEVTQKPAEPVDLSKLSDKQLDALDDIRRTLRGEKPEKPEKRGERDQPDGVSGDPAAPPGVH